MLITITNEQKVEVTLAPVTEAGNPATVDGVPVWEVVSGDATLEVATAADNAKDALRGPIFDFDEEVQKEKEAKELSAALHKALKEVSSLYDKAVEAHKKMK